MSEFLMRRPIFLPVGKDCFKLSIAVFIFGRAAAHIMLLLCLNTMIVVYHVFVERSAAASAEELQVLFI